jgi:TonB family protein
MHGKVSVGDKIETLATLGKKGQACKKGSFYALPLSERNRGKVYVGDYTILFQFVAPPPQPLRRRNSDFRGWRWEDVDWVFLAIMLLSALLHTAGVIWIESQPPPKRLRLEDFPDRFVKLMLPEDPPPPVESPKDDGDGDEVASDEPDEAPTSSDKPEEPAGEEPDEPVESAEDRQTRLEEEVSSQGLLAIIGTAGDTKSGSAVADLLSDAGSLSADVGSALANSAGVKVARHDADQAGLRGGGGGDAAASAGELGGAGGGPGGTVEVKQVELKGSVKTGSADIVSSSPEDTTSVARTMKRYTGRVKQCYEKELKGNPDLAGKVTVSFDIDTSGNVSGVAIAANTTGNSALADCIKNVVKRIRFVPPPEDEMEVAGYPFILARQ